MYITLHCGGIPFNGNTIAERSLGGSETAAYYLAKELAAEGHKVTLFTNDQNGGEFDGVRYLFSGEQSQEYPLGKDFTFYAMNTPCDVLIIQRHPVAFAQKYASKVNLWWLHDLASYRQAGIVQQHMWNIDGILTVSEYHKKQICEVYDFNPDIVHAIANGIDPALYTKNMDDFDAEWERTIPGPNVTGQDRSDQVKLIYSSRPERGLEHLVREGGIMDRLAQQDTDHHLYVCGYDNTTLETAGLYNALWAR